MKIYLITDTHFNHEKIKEYCGRPDNYEQLLWKGLENLPKDCLLIHLGDVCIGKDLEVHERIKKLPYKKILVKGNHDRKSDSWYLSNGWDFVCDKFSANYFGKNILFSHTPTKNSEWWDMNIHGHFHNNLHRLLEGKYVVDGEKERNEIDLNNLTPKHKLLAVENTNYKPVSLESIISRPNNNKIKPY